MGLSLESLALEALTAIVGSGEVNEFLINRLVNAGRNRPHPWSTRYPYICWSGLTDRSYNARFLPAKPYPAADTIGTRRPPIDDVVALFAPAATGQRVCPKSTSLFPAFAQYLTDGFIRTRVANKPPFGDGVEERARSTSNHEIDQSPLYGRTEAQTKVLRVPPAPGVPKGRLKTQSIGGEEFPPFLFGADRKVKPEFCDAQGGPVLDLPLGLKDTTPTPQLLTLFAVGGDRANATPQIAMLNTLFLREHNRLAGLLEAANAGWDDERVFQTARNIVIVMFIKIVVEEYINHINTSDFKFRAEPKVAWDAKWNRPNWMTAEFSLLYRWHSLVRENFDWNGDIVSGKTLLLDNSRLINGGLANAFVAVSANNATELGLGNSATFLAPVEQLAIAQARFNNIAGYNDYRRAMHLDPAKTFGDIVGKSDDPVEKKRRLALANELKRLYGSVEDVEFYVGLFAEPRERNGPLPDLLLAMVAMDAFSQALTNPLLSEHVWGNVENRELAFTKIGLEQILATRRLRDILVRNSTGVADRFVGMTRRDWVRR
jgi:prostaglandin-endoperoxide synthase 2